MQLLRLLSFVSVSLFCVGAARAQCFDWDAEFEPAGVDAEVRAQVVFDDGSGPALYIGGAFRVIGGAAASCIAKWDGSTWSRLSSGLTGGDTIVLALAVFDDGSGPALYAGGRFSSAGGVPASNIAKWDGDNWSALGAGISSQPGLFPEVRALTAYDDGASTQLFVGGEFSVAGAINVANIARWDGAQWTTAGNGAGANGVLHALCVYDSGSGPKLYAGGSFSTINGVSSPSLGAWDGSTWTLVDATFTDQVRALAVHDDGSGAALYIAMGGPTRVRRWDGVSTVVVGSGVGAQPVALASFDDGVHGRRLFVGTYFFSSPFFQAWDGASWSEPLSATPLNRPVRTLGVFDLGAGERLFVGGDFDYASPIRLEKAGIFDGTSITPIHAVTSVNGPVRSLVSYDFGSGAQLVAGGPFSVAGVDLALTLGVWDGSTWSNAGLQVLEWPPAGTVNALAAFDGSGTPELFAGGTIRQTFFGPSPNGLLRWNGSQWTAIGNGMGNQPGLRVNALEVADDGSGAALYVGGYFFQASGAPADFLARWNGINWVPFSQPYPGGEVHSIADFQSPSGPRVIVGSEITGHGTQRIREWNGTNWGPLGSGVNGRVYALATFDDGSGEALYAGGTFTTAGGLAASNIARWDGSQWTALGNGVDGGVYALEVFDDGGGPALYVGGNFNVAGSTLVNNIARWDGAQWTALGAGVDERVDALAVHDDGSGPVLILGGKFRTSGTVAANYMAKWSRACTCGPATYCTSGMTSNGCVPTISSTGTASASAGVGFAISITNVEGQRPGHIFYGLNGPHAAPWGGSSHFLCVKAPSQRTGTQASGGTAGACDGAIALDWNTYIATHPNALGVPFSAGTSVWAQLYFRDPAGLKKTALSNGLQFVVCP